MFALETPPWRIYLLPWFKIILNNWTENELWNWDTCVINTIYINSYTWNTSIMKYLFCRDLKSFWKMQRSIN